MAGQSNAAAEAGAQRLAGPRAVQRGEDQLAVGQAEEVIAHGHRGVAVAPGAAVSVSRGSASSGPGDGQSLNQRPGYGDGDAGDRIEDHRVDGVMAPDLDDAVDWRGDLGRRRDIEMAGQGEAGQGSVGESRIWSTSAFPPPAPTRLRQ